MTKAQCRKKCKILKKDVAQLIDKKIEKLLNSGAINFNHYEDNYHLPKIIITVIGGEIEDQYKPLSDEGKDKVMNLKLFV